MVKYYHQKVTFDKSFFVKYFLMHKYMYFIWYFHIKSLIRKLLKNRLVFYFKFFKKKQFKKFYFFKKNENYLVPSQLVMKRKFGLMKHRFNQRSFLLHKVNTYLNIKKHKKKRIKSHMSLLKKIHMGKLFYKKIRANVFINSRFSTTRQFKKSKILYNLYNKKNDPLINRFDCLVYTLISLKLFVNFYDAINYIKKIGIYYNYKLTKNPYTQIYMYDVIQLNADFGYYFYLKHMYKFFRKHFKKVKPRIYKLVRNRYDMNKQSATTIPKWVLNFKTFKEFKPNNFEYDLTTFTFIAIYNASKYMSIHYSNNYILSMYMYRLYNWRYIV